MRLADLGEKEIINLTDGGRFGQLSDAELLFDENTGKIKAIIVEDFRESKGFFGFGGEAEYIQLAWSGIKKIGADVIIFESN